MVKDMSLDDSVEDEAFYLEISADCCCAALSEAPRFRFVMGDT